MSIVALTLLTVFIAETLSQTPPSPTNVVWDSPSADARGSMPIGNGDIGVNVWVEPNGDLVFYISKTDTWSENARLLKLGQLRVRLTPSIVAKDQPFSQALVLRDGVIVIQSGSAKQATTIRFWIDANHPVVNVDVVSAKPIKVQVDFEPWRTKRRELKGQETHSAYGLHGEGAKPIFVEPDIILPTQKDSIVWYHRNERSIWADNLKLQALIQLTEKSNDPLLHRTFGGMICGSGLTRVSDTRLVSAKPDKRWSISTYILTKQTQTADAWVKALKQSVSRVESIDADARFIAHSQWWSAFWDRSWIHVSGDKNADRVSQAYALQRWINACAGRGKSPIKFNGSIFTVGGMRDRNAGPFDPDYRRWGGPYWWQNTRLPYWSMLYSGDFDMMQPLFRMYREALPLREYATQQYYKHDGAIFPETMYFWGTYVDGNYGRDRKGKPDGLTDNRYIRRYWQSGLELIVMMLDYHDQTDDTKFRDQTLLPLARSITTFFNEHWPRNDQGKIHFHPAQSLETWWDATNPLPEIVGLRFILPRLLKLPVDQKQKKVWRDMLDDLPPVPTRLHKEKTILVPAEKYTDKHNVENPELYAIFPYRLYGLTAGADRMAIGRTSFARRTHKGTGGWNQNAIKAALLGLTDEATSLVSANARSTAPGYRFPAMWGPNYDWIPDQDHGSVMMVALQRMLMQCDSDKIYLLPAWPKTWNVDFKLHAPNRTTIRGQLKEGHLIKLQVEPEKHLSNVVLPDQVKR